jgi:hypothetical protein
MLTWSLGWTGFLEPISPPSISMARFEMTSLAFMLVWVPEPVCQTDQREVVVELARATSAARRSWRRRAPAARAPRALLAIGAGLLMKPRARTMAMGWRSQPMGKFWMDRCVCAPQ